MKKQSIMSGRAIVLALLIVVVALMATLSCVSTKVVFAEEATGTTDNIMEFGGVEVDMSKYQQVTITKETKINSETIDNFVPTEWFNAKNGSIAYVGEHYGFLLEVDNGRNRVCCLRLIMKILL